MEEQSGSMEIVDMKRISEVSYKNLRVLVTGDTGFKGSWLCEWLVLKGAKVFGIGLDSNTMPSLFNQLDLEKRITHQNIDIRNYDELNDFILSIEPQVIFHLAAQPLVRQSYIYPIETYTTNVMGTIHLLDIMKNLPSKCVGVFVTTDKCYENKEWVYSYRENDNLGGFDPYSSSKGCCEIAINSFRKSYFADPLNCGKAVTSVRAGNVIGGGDWALDRIIPDCIRHLKQNLPIPIRNGSATRPWQHVLEPLGGYLQIGKELWENLTNPNLNYCGEKIKELSDAFNFGPELYSNRSVANLVEELLKHCEGSWVDKSDTNSFHEASLLNLSIDKAYHVLGWRPKWNFEKTVKETADWYFICEENEDRLAFTRDQIKRYQKD